MSFESLDHDSMSSDAGGLHLAPMLNGTVVSFPMHMAALDRWIAEAGVGDPQRRGARVGRRYREPRTKNSENKKSVTHLTP